MTAPVVVCQHYEHGEEIDRSRHMGPVGWTWHVELKNLANDSEWGGLTLHKPRRSPTKANAPSGA